MKFYYKGWNMTSRVEIDSDAFHALANENPSWNIYVCDDVITLTEQIENSTKVLYRELYIQLIEECPCKPI